MDLGRAFVDFAEGSDRVGHSNMLNKDGCGDYYVWSSIALGIPIGADCWSLLVVTVYVAMVCGFFGVVRFVLYNVAGNQRIFDLARRLKSWYPFGLEHHWLRSCGDGVCTTHDVFSHHVCFAPW